MVQKSKWYKEVYPEKSPTPVRVTVVKMHQTITEMILFWLLWQGECSVMRDVSKKRKGTRKQGNHPIELYGSHEEGWRQVLFQTVGWSFVVSWTKKGLGDFLTFTVFLEPRARVRSKIVTIYSTLPLPPIGDYFNWFPMYRYSISLYKHKQIRICIWLYCFLKDFIF